jgi:DNA gyrase subunit A
VILSRDGWLKRVREIKDISATRLREGDAVLSALRGSTKEAIAIFSNQGSCYVTRVNDVPASTGYGEPVQKLFNFRDGERAVGAMLLDAASAPPGAIALGITRHGYGMRFNLDPHRELSTRAGRRFAKAAEGDEIVGVSVAGADEVVCVITTEARALVCRVEEIPELANPGRGVIVIKTDADDPVVGFGVGRARDKEWLTAETDSGKKIPMGSGRPSLTARGGKGHALARKAKVVGVTLPEPPPPPTLLN